MNWFFCFFAYVDSIYIRHACNVTNMFQYVSKIQFFKFCRNIASVLIFSPDDSKSANVSSNIKMINIFCLPICKIWAKNQIMNIFLVQYNTSKSGKILLVLLTNSLGDPRHIVQHPPWENPGYGPASSACLRYVHIYEL